MGGGASKSGGTAPASAAASAAAAAAVPPGSAQAALAAATASTGSGGPIGGSSGGNATPRTSPRGPTPQRLRSISDHMGSAFVPFPHGGPSVVHSSGGSASSAGSGGTRPLHVGRHLSDSDADDADGPRSASQSEVEDASEEAMHRAIEKSHRTPSAGRRRGDRDRTSSPVGTVLGRSTGEPPGDASAGAVSSTAAHAPFHTRKRPLSATEVLQRNTSASDSGDGGSSGFGSGGAGPSGGPLKPRVASAQRRAYNGASSMGSFSSGGGSHLREIGGLGLPGTVGLGGSAWVDNSDFNQGVGHAALGDQVPGAQAVGLSGGGIGVKSGLGSSSTRPGGGMKSNIVSLPRIQQLPTAQQREFMKDLHDSMDTTMTPRGDESLGFTATTDVRALMGNLHLSHNPSSRVEGAARFNERFASCAFRGEEDSGSVRGSLGSAAGSNGAAFGTHAPSLPRQRASTSLLPKPL